MKLGIKVGPEKSSLDNLDATRVPFCEAHYNIAKADAYEELFAYTKRQNIELGLHFWGATPDGILANLAYPDTALIDTSLTQIRATIDTAACHNCLYVNIHPGHATKIHIDFDAQRIRIMSDPTDMQAAIHRFLEHAQALHDYASKRGVMLTIETAPPKDAADWSGNLVARMHPLETHGLPVAAVIEASKRGLYIANDVNHTAANAITDDPAAVWQFVRDTTIQLAPQTKLIHLGFSIPPYNGTDVHDQLDNPIFETDQAIPNKQQMIELLKIFHTRHDVRILAEPATDHVKNYFLAKKIIEKI